ncbi:MULTISPECIES: hypothetical protein [Haloferax]|uniref:Uncharacterized protein n=1 Tax=Haloferax marinisediminis TaxID=2666142 RepID=A0A6G1Z0M1_9EURY|nr:MULTISPECIES: hypothetical protein [Haloferax]MRW80090.1 hypothetical protein [Haloferax marinisediminis]
MDVIVETVHGRQREIEDAVSVEESGIRDDVTEEQVIRVTLEDGLIRDFEQGGIVSAKL